MAASTFATALNLSGRIVATTAIRAYGVSPALFPSRARFTTTLRGSLYLAPPLRGRIRVSNASRAGIFIMPALRGRIRAATSAGASTNVIPSNLAGRIRTSGAARVRSGATAPVLAGRIVTSVRARVVSGTLIPNLTGRITAISGATASHQLVIPLVLLGRITAIAKARTSYQVSGTIYLFGRVKTTARAAISAQYPVLLKGITSSRSSLSGAARPLFELFHSRISAMAMARLLTSELLEPLPPYPQPFPVEPLDHYLDYITSEHNQQPRYMQTVGFNVEPFVSDQALAATLPGLFDLDYSVGQQEDFTGQWIGKSRWIELPNVFFSWDSEGQGWNQANWRGPFDDAGSLQRLDDYNYRLLLYATVIANHWNGSVPHAYEAWDTLFHWTGLKVVIQDYGNMSMMYGLLWKTSPDRVLLSLFTTGQMDLRPEGVELISYIFQHTPEEPFFGFDADSDAINGWDDGAWGILVEPGTSISPMTFP